MKRILFCLIILLATSYSFIYSKQNALNKRLEIPQLKANEYIINHTGFSLSYNESCEQANWVAYELTAEKTKSVVSRTNKFMIDPAVKTESANNEDYSGSGYDKGHLAPAADMGWSAESMHDCFYYSNMSPQVPGFNRGIWERAEKLVRSWAIAYKDIYIVTGPILSTDLPSIGVDKVSVPKYYYKVVLDYHDHLNAKGIGFIIPNCSSTEPLQRYVVTIDSVEKLTGINFFPLLPQEQAKKIESKINLNDWTWIRSTTQHLSKKISNSFQCKGITRTGKRCKKKTTDPSGFCYLHRVI